MALDQSAWEMLGAWQKAQQGFWTAAYSQPAFADASAFAEPDWQAFDPLLHELLSTGVLERDGAALREALAAAAAYRDVILATWQRVQTAFETHRKAIHDPNGPPPDWRTLRDRWFDIAEVEFIRTLRARAFTDAQRDMLRAAVHLWHELPEGARDMARQNRALGQTAWRTLEALGAELIPIATSAKDVVWEEGRTTLSRYRPIDGQPPGLGPVLICQGLIGRQTMTDLRPDRSLVRQLLAAGVDVFTIDWGNPGPEDATKGMDFYVGRQLPQCIARAAEAAGAPGVTVLGICQGGTMAACHAARRPEGLDGLILAVTPIDFHADIHDPDPAHGLLNHWARAMETEDLEALVGMDGNLPGELMGMIFNQLNPVRTLAKYAIEMTETVADPAAATMFLAMEKWLSDRPDLPGAMARTLMVDFYHDNALVKGAFALEGDRIDLSRIDVPVLNVFATGDHIIPPPCSRALGLILSGRDYEELALPTGHVGTFVSARAQTLLAPRITEWLKLRHR